MAFWAASFGGIPAGPGDTEVVAVHGKNCVLSNYRFGRLGLLVDLDIGSTGGPAEMQQPARPEAGRVVPPGTSFLWCSNLCEAEPLRAR